MISYNPGGFLGSECGLVCELVCRLVFVSFAANKFERGVIGDEDICFLFDSGFCVALWSSLVLRSSCH